MIQADPDHIAHAVLEPLPESSFDFEQLFAVPDSLSFILFVLVFVLWLNLDLLDILEFSFLSEHLLLPLEFNFLDPDLLPLEVLDFLQDHSQGDFATVFFVSTIKHVHVHSDLLCGDLFLGVLQVMVLSNVGGVRVGRF